MCASSSGEDVTRSFGPTRAMGPAESASMNSLPVYIRPLLTILVIDVPVRQMRSCPEYLIRMPQLTPAAAEWTLEGSESAISAILRHSVQERDGRNEEPPVCVPLCKARHHEFAKVRPKPSAPGSGYKDSAQSVMVPGSSCMPHPAISHPASHHNRRTNDRQTRCPRLRRPFFGYLGGASMRWVVRADEYIWHVSNMETAVAIK
jgi:hypothetical protein